MVKGYHVSDVRFQNQFYTPQNVKIVLRFDTYDCGNSSAGIFGYALVLNNRLISISSQGQTHFDLKYL